MTRKSKCNRKKIYEKCGPISVRSLTNTIEKNRAKLKNCLPKGRRKLKKQSSQIWNEKFFDDQKKVYTEFRTLIEEDKENIKPVFKERKEVKPNYIQDTGEVIDFCTKLWSIENEGNDNPEWLHDIQENFCEIVKEIDISDIVITEKEQWDAIRKKELEQSRI